MAKCIPNKPQSNVSFTGKNVELTVTYLPKKVNKDLCYETLLTNTVFDYTFEFLLA